MWKWIRSFWYTEPVITHLKRSDEWNKQMKVLLLEDLETFEVYSRLGIDPSNPNPDGSDYHLMNLVDKSKPNPLWMWEVT